MSRAKKIFLILAALFIAAVLYFVYDISSKTTFPGSKPGVEENNPGAVDSLE